MAEGPTEAGPFLAGYPGDPAQSAFLFFAPMPPCMVSSSFACPFVPSAFGLSPVLPGTFAIPWMLPPLAFAPLGFAFVASPWPTLEWMLGWIVSAGVSVFWGAASARAGRAAIASASRYLMVSPVGLAKHRLAAPAP